MIYTLSVIIEISSIRRFCISPEGASVIDTLQAWFNKMTLDLMSLSSEIDMYCSKFPIQISVKEKKIGFIGWGFLEVSFHFDSEIEIECTVQKGHESYQRKLCIDEIIPFFSDNLEKYLYDLFLITNVSYPGCLSLGAGKILLNRKKIVKKIKRLHSPFAEIFINTVTNRHIGPVLQTIPLQQSWDWFLQRTNFFEGTSKHAVDRALNALSFTVNANNHEELLYTLIGLEALYNNNEVNINSIMKQIYIKTKILLQDGKDYKKSLKFMYEVRSSFIHGSLNFRNKHTFDYDNEEFNEKFYKALMTSLSVLIASIQKLILADSNGIEENYSIKLIKI